MQLAQTRKHLRQNSVAGRKWLILRLQKRSQFIHSRRALSQKPIVYFVAMAHPTAKAVKKVVAGHGVVEARFLFDAKEVAAEHQRMSEGFAVSCVGEQIARGQANAHDRGTRTFGKQLAQAEIPVEIAGAGHGEISDGISWRDFTL